MVAACIFSNLIFKYSRFLKAFIKNIYNQKFIQY